jgi:ubiquinone/menaquinone biosynthesis C-methylase UbiE
LEKRLYRWFYDHVLSRCYDLLIKWYFLPLGGEHRVRSEQVKAAGLREGSAVLDMCCGTGGATLAIAEQIGPEATIVGIDLSAGQIERARRKNRFANVDFLVGDAADTGFEEGQFDCVVIPYALHEMARDERLRVLKEARRVLADGGELAIVEMDTPPGLLNRLLVGFWAFYWVPFNPETRTRRDMLRHGLETEVREAGFCDVSKEPLFGGVFQVVKGRK